MAPPADAFGSERTAERPIGSCPQRSFASIDDGRCCLTVANRGLAEVEAVGEADGSTSLAVTLLRAVGWLSRSDLALRGGDAGPSLPTPGAQVPGPLRAELSLRLEPVDATARVAQAHRFAYPPLAFAGGVGSGAPLRDGDSLVAVSEPQVLLTAIEPRDGGAIVRGYNPSPVARRVRVRWLASPDCRIERIDLSERPVGPEGRGEVEIELRPWEIFNLRVRSLPPGASSTAGPPGIGGPAGPGG